MKTLAFRRMSDYIDLYRDKDNIELSKYRTLRLLLNSVALQMISDDFKYLLDKNVTIEVKWITNRLDCVAKAEVYYESE